VAIGSCLVDTNVLLRITRRGDPQYRSVNSALSKLVQQRTILYFTHQNIAELWNAMTRPLDRNGFGLSPFEAEQQVQAIEAVMVLLPDSEAVYRQWRKLIVQHNISGVSVHDARLAAAMQVSSVTHVLTFNGMDFTRFSGVIAVDPKTV
jgi:predicted nucleic acid-binding protein